ncbi:LDH2 family malate/lactate/ureidoglycolate dehydrogenase [Actinoplanes lutulentus]|uniref:LDH2 family malate/lactate/ureidoglycolate dehydrogenase n=1 Tax=Actinoplanes lutulentus TaxID=1287878 RepID=A0A327ZJL0_9ACTN|nr:Ldh family oxidoreductase [Actinoplanes lutulentus]MBB2943928.1 LDH2 family malate/lactate/ureidoglycolate dehydrogenase [Actinoplanes lutulentus]RAK42839.1 LDH2 family malate/lactate/ureidoglycolate dehydrogenase [Actinoplanes lutulentus]
MPPPKVLVPAAELRTFTTALFAAAGVSAEHAATISDVLTWASLRGVDSHGASRVPRYLELLDSGEANKAPALAFGSTSPAVAVLDADRAPGPVALTAAADEAISRARASGIGAVGVRRTVHTGAIGYYTSRIADAGLVGIAFVAGMPNMAYPGVKGAAVATSPLSIAVPAPDRPPALLDMATAGIALGKIAQFRNAGKQLPEGTAATADGTPTTDPNLAKMPLPLGGVKGAGMSLVFELLTSVLVGAPILSSFHSDDPQGRVHRQNALILALDPAAFGNADEFGPAVAGTLTSLKGLTRADDESEIRYPGEGSAAVAGRRTAEGVPVAAKVWAEIQVAAEKLGVPAPV